ncbi:FAD-binding oxidoreductase [Rhodobacteraceae bacterium RKSG542]|uniref:NAD(P)/FAD-dependent oxidoreductase n=1 Tax=Pseudovibrio flavus TaxID=2529854 RepID=UPI0012BCB963|nr:FAD-binding oxidoreductase [Pseudovibrio flavus]MTI18543.1 FAD-binding oxidoreductase [Pseudovibrio flavus]
MAHKTVDVAIVGGAVMGSATAYNLVSHKGFSGSVCVIEKDPSYQQCASALSAASIRQQFSSAINIEISLYGIDFLRNIGEHLEVDGDKPRIDLVEGGYLFLATPETRHILEANHQTQISMGADIAWYEPDALLQKFPWLNVEDIAAGCHGTSGEGWFDGYGLMQAFRRKARSLGVPYIDDEVCALERSGSGWLISLKSGETIEAGTIVNTAGASGGAQICEMANVTVPIHSRKRSIFTFECRDIIPNLPLLVDPTGTYVRPEGHCFICGCSPEEDNDPDSYSFEVDYSYFEEHLWPTLAHRIPAFEAIKPGAAWSGHYDMNLFDHNAFVGPVEQAPNFYIAVGFSGHGLQQAPAVGRALAEHIVSGSYETLDMSELSLDRLYEDRKLIEVNVV